MPKLRITINNPPMTWNPQSVQVTTLVEQEPRSGVDEDMGMCLGFLAGTHHPQEDDKAYQLRTPTGQGASPLTFAPFSVSQAFRKG